MNVAKFILFANCIPVKGYQRSIICDLQNNNFFLIPSGLYYILIKYSNHTIQDVKNEFDKEYHLVIDEYFNFLIKENLIFFNSNPILFPKLDLTWKTPSLINNIIIDYKDIMHDFISIGEQLEELKCSNIQCRFFQNTDLNYIVNLVKTLENIKSRVSYIDFILPHYENLSNKDLFKVLETYPRIHSITIYNSPNDKKFDAIRENMGYLIFIKKNISDIMHCGNISTKYFYSNVKLFTESQNYNSCLNRKISIDQNGDIRNCPSMSKTFGNIKDTTLKQALVHNDFKKYWEVSKNQIEVCKDCEFRFICTDCRAYTERTTFDKNDIDLSKPLKCGYNPYTNVWEEWSINPIKQKSIKHYKMRELVKKE